MTLQKKILKESMVEPKEKTKYCVDCKHNTCPAMCFICLEEDMRNKPKWEEKDATR